LTKLYIDYKLYNKILYVQLIFMEDSVALECGIDYERLHHKMAESYRAILPSIISIFVLIII